LEHERSRRWSSPSTLSLLALFVPEPLLEAIAVNEDDLSMEACKSDFSSALSAREPNGMFRFLRSSLSWATVNLGRMEKMTWEEDRG
jgi:hypothetical protein